MTFLQSGKHAILHIIHSFSEVDHSGWCLDSDGKDIKGDKVIPGIFTWDQCLESCENELEATACQWHVDGGCAYQTVTVTTGSYSNEEFLCKKIGNEFQLIFVQYSTF